MRVMQAFRFELDPNCSARVALAKHVGAARFARSADRGSRKQNDYVLQKGGAMDLEMRWEAFQEAARRRGLRIYPGLPPNELRASAFWEGEPDGGEAFLDLARDLGVGLIYISARPFDPEAWAEDLGDPEDLPPDLRAEAERLLREADRWRGRLASFAALWV